MAGQLKPKVCYFRTNDVETWNEFKRFVEEKHARLGDEVVEALKKHMKSQPEPVEVKVSRTSADYILLVYGKKPI